MRQINSYRVAVPKGDLQGYAQDPSQQQGNSQGVDLNTPLTVKNIANIGVATVYGKKVVNAGYTAIVGQLGNSRLERAIEVGTKGLTYLGIGVASGAAAGITVPLAIITDVTVKAINDSVESHNQGLTNQRIVEERGTRIELGAGGYYG